MKNKFINIINELQFATEDDLILKIENKLAFSFAIAMDYFVAISNLIITYLVISSISLDDILKSLVFILFSFIKIGVFYFLNSDKLKSDILNAIISIALFLTVVFFYHLVGIGLWAAYLIYIFISIIQKRDMLFYSVIISMISGGIYTSWFKVEVLSTPYRYAITVLFILLAVLIAISVRNMYKTKIQIIHNQNNDLSENSKHLMELNSVLEEELKKQFESEKLLKIAKENYEHIFNGSSDPILLLNESSIIDCNQAALEMWNYYSKDEIIGSTLLELSPKYQDNQLSSELMIRYFTSFKKQKNPRFEWIILDNYCNEIITEVRLSKMKLQERDVYHLSFRDITDRKKMEENLAYLSFHDALTGIYNRRYFEEEMMRIDDERNLPISIIMADLNGLKVMNDTYGHNIGDELLISAAEVLKEAVRNVDVISRIGGDEFVVLLPQTSAEKGLEVLNRLKSSLNEKEILGYKLSMALGLGTKENKTQGIMEVFRIAEDAMYKNKIDEKTNKR